MKLLPLTFRRRLTAVGALFLAGAVFAQEAVDSRNVDASGKYTPQAPPPGAAMSREDAEAKMRGMLQIERDGADKVRIGSVIVDAKRRTVTFPAWVNMDSGVIEYALVADYGKVHEALFKTTSKPQEIHLACLLLSAAAAKDSVPEPMDRQVRVSVYWDTNGPEARHELSEMVVTAKDPTVPTDTQPLPLKPWNYTGSTTDAQGFAATREGSIISLITDAAALITNPGESAKRDDNHLPNKRLLPAKGSPVRIVLSFPDPQAPKASQGASQN